MNTELLQRATFVIDRATADRLSAIADRLGVSRSALVRDVLKEPIELMDRWVSMLPPGTKLDADSAMALRDRIESDVSEFLDAKAAQLDLLGTPEGGNA